MHFVKLCVYFLCHLVGVLFLGGVVFKLLINKYKAVFLLLLLFKFKSLKRLTNWSYIAI